MGKSFRRDNDYGYEPVDVLRKKDRNLRQTRRQDEFAELMEVDDEEIRPGKNTTPKVFSKNGRYS